MNALNLAINGFGRIGRLVLRAWFERGCPESIRWVGINDLTDAATLAHMLRYDSTHGRFPHRVEFEQDQLNISNYSIPLSFEPEPGRLPWVRQGVDVVLECTGHFRSRAAAEKHLKSGASRVIIAAAPFDPIDFLVVYGFNHEQIRNEHRILSSVSCTTHALVPPLIILQQHLGIVSMMVTEVHAVTSDQHALDHVHRDLRRARACGSNIIPTTTSALGALRQLFPELADRMDGHSIRVPTANVAMVEITIEACTRMDVAALNQLFLEASRLHWPGIMSWIHEPLVSSDFIHEPWSCVFDATQTRSLGNLHQVVLWYDNEWGYANRLLDLCLYLAKSR